MDNYEAAVRRMLEAKQAMKKSVAAQSHTPSMYEPGHPLIGVDVGERDDPRVHDA